MKYIECMEKSLPFLYGTTLNHFRYGNHRWAVSFLREEKKLGTNLIWKNVSEVIVLIKITPMDMDRM